MSEQRVTSVEVLSQPIDRINGAGTVYQVSAYGQHEGQPVCRVTSVAGDEAWIDSIRVAQDGIESWIAERALWR